MIETDTSEQRYERAEKARRSKIKKWIVAGTVGLVALVYGLNAAQKRSLRDIENERRVTRVVEQIEKAKTLPYNHNDNVQILNCAPYEGININDDPRITEAYSDRVASINNLNNEKLFDVNTGTWYNPHKDFLPRGEHLLIDVDANNSVSCPSLDAR